MPSFGQMDAAILQSLNELLGLALVMTLGGLAVAALTQGTALVSRARRRHLCAAVELLLARVHAPRNSAAKVMRHPMVGSSLRCVELLRVLLEVSPETLGIGVEEARRLLRALEAELAQGGVATALKGNAAADRICCDFARAMERATRQYRLETRCIAAAAGAAAVWAMRLDSLDILGRAARLQRAPAHCVGMALAWMLVSLGAPFWYDRVKDLLHLRPGRE